MFAPLDIVLTEYDVVQPDLLVFAPGRAHLVHPLTVTREPPDLVVEILSPATVRNDRGRKMSPYAHHGVKEYWLFDPENVRMEIYRLGDAVFEVAETAVDSETARSDFFPDLSVRLCDLVL